MVIYYLYDDEIKDLDNYLIYSYDANTQEYKLTLGEEAEKYFYFATGMDNDNYVSLNANLLNNYIDHKK